MDMGKIDKVIVWGCSISNGLNADKDKIYGQRVADWLGVPLINLSISGGTTPYSCKRVGYDLPK